jgi:hypothetical protein
MELFNCGVFGESEMVDCGAGGFLPEKNLLYMEPKI